MPAASVWVAETEMVPFPRVVRSAEVRTTACAEPLPVSVLVTVPPPLRLKVTEMAALFSPVTVTTPPAAMASADVAPLETPVPRASVGAAGGVVSATAVETVKLKSLLSETPSFLICEPLEY